MKLNEVPKQVQSYLDLGKKVGSGLQAAEVAAAGLARDIALAYGEHFGPEAMLSSANDWLTGFASGFEKSEVGKVRKSEMWAVFRVFRDDKDYTMVMGLDAEKKPIHETRKATAWLKAHNEIAGFKGWHGLVKLARKTQEAASGGTGGNTATGTRTSAPRLTDNQFAEFVERMPAAKSTQINQLLDKSISAVVNMPQGEAGCFRIMLNAANAIKRKSSDKAHLEVAAAVVDLVTQHLTKLQETALAAQKPVVIPEAANVEVEQTKTGTHG